MRILIAVCLAGILAGFLCLTAVAEEPFGLKGIQIGQSATRAQMQSAFGTQCLEFDLDSDHRGMCALGVANIADAMARVIVTMDHHRVQQISAIFDARDFESVSMAFIRKYGDPAETKKSNAQTLGGAQLNVVYYFWENIAGDQIVIVNYSDALHSAMLINTKAERELLAHAGSI